MSETKRVLISAADAAKKFDVSRPYIYHLIKQNKLEKIEENGSTFIDEEKASIYFSSKKSKKKAKKTKAVKEVKKVTEEVTTNDNELYIYLVSVAVIGAVMGYMIATLNK